MSQAAGNERGLYAAVFDLLCWGTASQVLEHDGVYKAFLEYIQGETAKQAAITKEREAMILTIGDGGEREPAPEGMQRATCTEIKDLGIVTTQYGDKRKVEFRFELEAKNSRGFPFVLTRTYNAVLSVNQKTGKKSDLRRDLDMWRGKPFTDDEIKSGKADTDQFVGRACILSVEHKLGTQGGTFAAVTAVMPAAIGVPAAPKASPLEAALKASLKNPPAEDPSDPESEPY